jgi:hypothetical protein
MVRIIERTQFKTYRIQATTMRAVELNHGMFTELVLNLRGCMPHRATSIFNQI